MVRKNQSISLAMVTLMLLCLCLCACAGSGDSETYDTPSDSPAQSTTADITPSPSPEIAIVPADVPSAEEQPEDNADTVTPTIATGEVVITFDYVRQSGSASNQHAVWIEDMDGRVVRTLYASRWTADGGYKRRPDSIALWAERSGLASMTSSEVDALSGATPSTGTLDYTWDLTNTDGETVLSGDYMFFVEGTLRWKNYVLYSGVITIGDTPATVSADAEFNYEGDGRYAALTASSSENGMIGAVTATFTPSTDN